MLNLTTIGAGRLCEGPSRRDILRAGSLGAFGAGLGLADLLEARAGEQPRTGPEARSGFGRAKSCIVLFLMGGPPQHSTWDPKPEAPEEIRGAFGPISTNVPGMQISELMPMTAQVADRTCLLRAVSTGDNAHSSSGYYMLTGQPHQPMNFENANPGPPNDMPHFGAVLGAISGGRGGMPPSVRLPHKIFNTDGSVWPGQDAGFLGRAADPWLLNANLTPEGYAVEEIGLPADLGPDRLASRRDLIDRIARRLSSSTEPNPSPPSTARLARRTTCFGPPEAARPFVWKTSLKPSRIATARPRSARARCWPVDWSRPGCGWSRSTGIAAPTNPRPTPAGIATPTRQTGSRTSSSHRWTGPTRRLLEDLSRRGLLDETLVVCMAEFGRSPRLQPNGGRGHWGSVFTVALAGGGVRGGQVYGASDAVGGHPREGMVRPEDLTATIFHCLGVAPTAIYRDSLNRPFPASRGEVLHTIL